MKKLQTQFLSKDSESTEENYDYMLGVLPPRMMASNAFLVGEPDDHGGENGSARYGLYFTENGKYYYGGKTTVKEFMAFLIEEKKEPKKEKEKREEKERDEALALNTIINPFGLPTED